ncbi:MAG: hypothetical protein EBR82_77885, partial [Caulobacteraceae bacterium]|nr:hypothetical protein [Caulobacteraceae bacterium]
MAEASVVAVLVFVLMYAYSRMVPRKSRWRGDLPYGTGQTPFIFNADTSADNAPVLGEDGTKVIGKVMGQPWTQG